MAFLAQKLISASGPKEATDPDFNLVTQLYQFDGSNGAQNNTYVDSSSTSKTLTESGNVAQGTFSPFSASEGKWGVDFSRGNPDWLYSNDSDFSFGTGDFTIECFVFFGLVTTTGQGLFQLSSGALNSQDGRGPAIGTYGGTGKWHIYYGAGENQTNTVGSAISNPDVGKWIHVAFVRTSGTIKIFIDGTQIGSDISYTGNYTDTYFTVGGWYSDSYTLRGRLSNFRVVNGTAVYTSNFTVPTAILPDVTNTKLLTCRSNRIFDASSAANSLFVGNGAPAVQPLSPFAPSASYNAAVNGGSSHFPTGQTGNKIECGTSADFAFGTGAFTIEAWVYVTADTYPYSRIMNIGPYWNNVNSIGLLADDTDNSSKIALGVYGAVTNARVCVSTNATPQNQWFHVAVTRDGTGDFRLFVNGNLDSTNTSYRTVDVSSGGNQPLTIGGTTDRAVEEPFEGFISNFRVVKGTAVYTSSFTVPTAPVADVTNTKLLANFTNAAMFDQSGKTNIETVGNAQLNTSIKKFGTASAKFDESGDYLIVRNVPYLYGGDFTIEGFVYFNSSPTDGQGLFVYDSQSLGNRAGVGPALGTYANAPYQGKWHSYYGTQASGGTGTQGNSEATPSATTWIHFAYVRTSGVIKIFIGGSQIGSDIAWTNSYIANDVLTIAGYYSTSYLLNGYIDSYRVTLKARYTSNFTPPSEEFPNR